MDYKSLTTNQDNNSPMFFRLKLYGKEEKEKEGREKTMIIITNHKFPHGIEKTLYCHLRNLIPIANKRRLYPT